MTFNAEQELHARPRKTREPFRARHRLHSYNSMTVQYKRTLLYLVARLVIHRTHYKNSTKQFAPPRSKGLIQSTCVPLSPLYSTKRTIRNNCTRWQEREREPRKPTLGAAAYARFYCFANSTFKSWGQARYGQKPRQGVARMLIGSVCRVRSTTLISVKRLARSLPCVEARRRTSSPRMVNTFIFIYLCRRRALPQAGIYFLIQFYSSSQATTPLQQVVAALICLCTLQNGCRITSLL